MRFLLWLKYVYMNAVAAYVLALLSGLLRDGTSHLMANLGLLTLAVFFGAIDQFLLRRWNRAHVIRRKIDAVMFVKALLQMILVYDVIMGLIAIGFIGIHVYGMSFKPVIGPIGSEWSYELQVYATVVTMGLISFIPLIAYAVLRPGSLPDSPGEAGKS